MFELSGSAQGTGWRIKYFAPDSMLGYHETDSVFQLIDSNFSLYNDSSLVSRINNPAVDTISVSFVFQGLFRAAEQIGHETNAFFSINIGPLVNAWGFGRGKRRIMENINADSLLRICNNNAFRLEGKTLIKNYEGAALDFNAIAQGFTLDLISDLMDRKGIKDYIIELGGEVKTSGLKPDGSRWIVGIEAPGNDSSSSERIIRKFHVSGLSAATAGSWRKFYIKEGKRFSHTINPKTGRPVEHSLLSATVLAEECYTADAYATAFMAMGMDKALEFLRQRDELQVFFIYEDEEKELRTYFTENFPLTD